MARRLNFGTLSRIRPSSGFRSGYFLFATEPVVGALLFIFDSTARVEWCVGPKLKGWLSVLSVLCLPIPEKTEPEVELPKTEIRNRNVERKSPALVYVRLTSKLSLNSNKGVPSMN